MKVSAVYAKHRISEWGKRVERVEDNEPTRRGNQFDQRAHERMIIKKPTARTKESRMTAGQK